MLHSKSCLLLGNKRDTLKLKKIILKKKWNVVCKNKKITKKDLINIDLLITFNYRLLLKKNILRHLKRPAINLHVSYLPFNRGCHPNFWSFVENSPKGVSIHEISKKVDKGPIIYRKKITFNINKKSNENFSKTYKILLSQIQKLFSKNINQILSRKYNIKKQRKNGSFHYRNELPKFMKNNWNIKIKDALKIYTENKLN
tara:strand:+ start:818 stop:1417 length:600 start_codon:yes stop_codon:yes gene_type:complete